MKTLTQGYATTAFDIIPSDTVLIKDQANNTRGHELCFLMCKTNGAISFVTAEGDTLTVAGYVARTIVGFEMPILVKQVLATGTTGTWLGLVRTGVGR